MKWHVLTKVLVLAVLSATLIGLTAGCCCCWSGGPSWSVPQWSAGMIRGSGNVIQEDRDVSSFDRVATTSSGDVVITQTGQESLTVETDDNIMQYVETEVRGGTLYLGIKPGASVSTTRLRFTVTANDLAGLETSSSGDIESGSIDTDRLEVEVSSSGDIRIDSLTAETLAVKISSSGSVEVSGEVSEQDVNLSSSGKYRAGDLRSETVELTISSSGDATIWATESLDARLSSSGSVNYYGNPQTDISATSSGDATSLGEK